MLDIDNKSDEADNNSNGDEPERDNKYDDIREK